MKLTRNRVFATAAAAPLSLAGYRDAGFACVAGLLRQHRSPG
jgi:hypothetical protein